MENRKFTQISVADAEILEGIKQFISEKGYIPSVRDLAAYLNITPAKAYHHKAILKAVGLN